MHFSERFSERWRFPFAFQHLYKLQIGFDSHHPLHFSIPQPSGCGIFLSRIRTLPLRCAAGHGGRFPAPTKKFSLSARVTITTRIFIYIIIFSILLYSSLFCSILFYSSLFCSMYRQEADVAAPSARRRLPPAERRAAAGFSCGGIIYLITAE